MFSKEASDKTDTKAAPATGEGALSIVAHGMTVTGDIDSTGVVKIEGRVEGSVRSARQVLVGRQGEVRGDIDTREAIIGGRVTGTVSATERVEIKEGALIVGDINTKTIVVLEGGKINGGVRMEEPVVAPREAGLKPQQKAQQPVAVVR